ncbi:MAG: tryptophan synthase subunit alpha, partial [Deltaproteobacteria bacterium]|nr:tryptophan synthase subunit alpha [Deltaproteobacteria bacterium]
QRLKKIAAQGRGFLYYVSLTGVTGAGMSVSPELGAGIRRVKSLSRVPVAVGFGVSGPDQARALASVADGVIVGSALVRAVLAGQDSRAQVAAVFELAAELKGALRVSPRDSAAEEGS